MFSKKLSSAVVIFSLASIFFLIAGCGQKKSDINLPENEAKQFQEADEEQSKASNAGLKGAEKSPAGEFKKFYLDEWPTLAWPCGFDLSPESLYERATGKRIEWLTN